MLGRQEGNILEVSGLEKGDNRICMVLEWTLLSLGLPTPGSIFSAAVSLYISREHGRLRTTRHFV